MKPSLSAAREAATAARARHDADLAALAIAREQRAAAKAVLTNLATDDDAAVQHHARRLEARARKGESGPPPALVPSDKHVAAQVSAQRTHAATVQLVTNLEAAERESSAEVAQAEEALQNAALATAAKEITLKASELDRAEAKVEELRALVNAGRAIAGIEQFLPVSVAIALRDDLNTPINLIPDRGDFARPVGEVRMRPTPVDASAHWRARIEQLLTGDGTEPTSVAA